MRLGLAQCIVVEASAVGGFAVGNAVAWVVVGKVADKAVDRVVGTPVVADSPCLHSISVERLGQTLSNT